jgi:hypothetical protein
MPTLTPDRDVKSKAVRILAKSIYRDLQLQGFDHKQIVALATELISEVTSSLAQGEVMNAPLPQAPPAAR